MTTPETRHRRGSEAHAGSPRPFHRLEGSGCVHVEGQGALRLVLSGEGTVVVRNLARTRFACQPAGDACRFAGVRRFPDVGTLVVQAGRGHLLLEGESLDVRVEARRILLEASGVLVARLDGRGAWDAPDGDRHGWGLRPRRVDLV